MLDFNDLTLSASPEQANAELLSEFLNQHKRADRYAAQDVDNCHSGLKGDRETINLLLNPSSDRAQIARVLRGDIDQDIQAGGNDQDRGYDQQSIAMDQATIDVDQRVLNSGLNLSSAAKQALQEDIRLHNVDAQLSRTDIASERIYAQDDQTLLNALNTGIGIREATAQVQQDRIMDMDTENKFLKNDLSIRASYQRLMKFFGDTP